MTKTPAVILVRPQMGENIGAAARAMFNFGLTDLRLVSPRDSWPDQRAIDMSSGALDKMPPVQVFETLPEALADLRMVYATTARPRDMVKPVFTPKAAIADSYARFGDGDGAGLVFGPERTGLENEELSLCHAIVTVPNNPDFPSINLAQAVLLMAYEWFQHSDDTPDKMLVSGDSGPADHADLLAFLERLENALEDGGFFKSDDLRPTMVRNIRAMFTRAELTHQEVQTLHGMVSALIRR